MARQKSKKKLFAGLCVCLVVAVCFVLLVVTQFVKQDQSVPTVDIQAAGMTFETQEDGHVAVQSERPDASAEEETTIDGGDVFSKPEESASVIGHIDKDTKVSRYGEASENGYYTISYNGRIGYISADVFEDSEEQTGDSASNTTTSQGASSTTVTSNTGSSSADSGAASAGASTPASTPAATPSGAGNSGADTHPADASSTSNQTPSSTTQTPTDNTSNSTADDDSPADHVFPEEE